MNVNQRQYNQTQLNRNQLMRRIYESGFAAYDAALYLDTHPYDTEALAYYRKMNHIYNEASNEYSALYGPLKITQMDNDQNWSWAEGPWPWEVGGCQIMWNYEKRLEYPVKITNTNPKIAQIIMSQYGGLHF